MRAERSKNLRFVNIESLGRSFRLSKRPYLFFFFLQERIQDFFKGFFCSTSTPMNHIVFFLQNTSCIKKPQAISGGGGGGGGGGAAPPPPPPPSPPPVLDAPKLASVTFMRWVDCSKGQGVWHLSEGGVIQYIYNLQMESLRRSFASLRRR